MSAKKIFIVNGPNLNMLGKREPEIYGNVTLSQIEAQAARAATERGYEVEFSQSNCEGEIINVLHRAYTSAAAVIINAGAYTHYSYAIADAVKMLKCPVIELHLSNVFAREEFRRNSVISPHASAVICGAGAYGYTLAVECAVNKIENAK